MKKLVLASVSALALFGVAACSDSTDNTTTQSVPETTETAPAPADPAPATPPAVDDSTTQSIDPTPDSSTGGEIPDNDAPMDAAPVDPAPAPAPAP
jgi:hypothetical protein